MRVRNAHLAAKNVVKPYWFICVNWRFFAVCWNRNIENLSKIKKQTFFHAVSGQKKNSFKFRLKTILSPNILDFIHCLRINKWKVQTFGVCIDKTLYLHNEEKYSTLHSSSERSVFHSICSSIIRMTEMRMADSELKYVFD